MLNKEEVKDLICDRFWKYREITPKKTFTTLFIGTKAGSGMLALCFRRNGRITFPTNVAFEPDEYRYWDFDEDTQEIVFLNNQNQISRRAKLPVRWFGGGFKMQLISDKNEVFSHEPHVDKYAIKKRIIGGTHMFFCPRSVYEFELFQDLAFLNFDIKLINAKNSIIDFFNEVYQYLIVHPQLEEVVISQVGQPIVELSEEEKILFANKDNQPSYKYFSGERALVLELLTVVLSENNKRLLNRDDYRNEEEMLQDIILNKFANRYEIAEVFAPK
ncbi:hypothetical protein [Pediococcus acidilactici]|uniref:hypothetical protein n=1 Tax=Pediococcus acidilactici TaxID=1254 RepID=UPI00232ECC85|nr:hypothetical protein [Pediococcus acidilactici]MDB8859149.1 hypothetical protein [Pediococcus acidilactici]MDB8860232.1 hypothetical protein [Pediococcus acidilactici]MDB8863714.1 hypothetical protein [Pediococcus acidilactici]MDB8867240.1 hypothetical protein [Pediococcus acidilactici]